MTCRCGLVGPAILEEAYFSKGVGRSNQIGCRARERSPALQSSARYSLSSPVRANPDILSTDGFIG